MAGDEEETPVLTEVGSPDLPGEEVAEAIPGGGGTDDDREGLRRVEVAVADEKAGEDDEVATREDDPGKCGPLEEGDQGEDQVGEPAGVLEQVEEVSHDGVKHRDPSGPLLFQVLPHLLVLLTTDLAPRVSLLEDIEGRLFPDVPAAHPSCEIPDEVDHCHDDEDPEDEHAYPHAHAPCPSVFPAVGHDSSSLKGTSLRVVALRPTVRAATPRRLA